MGFAMTSLAIACVAVGVAGGPVSAVIARLCDRVLGEAAAPPVEAAIPVVGFDALYAAAPITLLLVAFAAGTWILSERGRRARRVPTWTCGIAPEPAFEYTATSYGKLIRLYYGPILRPAREITVEHHAGTPFPHTVRYHGHVRHVIDERFYGPLHQAAVAGAELVRRLQSGSLQLYLAYTVVALVALLLIAR
jgi:hydrogenase-4 component B